MKVTHIKASQRAIIKNLKDMLEMAENGDLTAIAFAASKQGDFIVEWWETNEDLGVTEIIAALEILKQRIILDKVDMPEFENRVSGDG